MRVRMALTVLAFGVAFAGMAFAADDPIQARRDIMKSNNEAAKVAFGMVMGKVPYDATPGGRGDEDAAGRHGRVPDAVPGGQRQGRHAASPAIWQNMEDFKAHAAKLAADAKVAACALKSSMFCQIVGDACVLPLSLPSGKSVGNSAISSCSVFIAAAAFAASYGSSP